MAGRLNTYFTFRDDSIYLIKNKLSQFDGHIDTRANAQNYILLFICLFFFFSFFSFNFKK